MKTYEFTIFFALISESEKWRTGVIKDYCALNVKEV